MDMIVNDYFTELFPEANLAADPIQVRPFNIGSSVNMRELDPSGASLYFDAFVDDF